jgi:hypothetical protein
MREAKNSTMPKRARRVWTLNATPQAFGDAQPRARVLQPVHVDGQVASHDSRFCHHV